MTATDQEFDALTEPDLLDNCQLWVGPITTRGYGVFQVCGEWISASRYAWERINGPVPLGLYVGRNCGQRRCVNPKHLLLVGQDEAIGPVAQNGRALKHHPGKIMPEDVRAIRADVRNLQAIAADYDVNEGQVHGIKSGRHWAWLE